MQFNIDTGIIIMFLVINFSVGLFYSRGKTSLREYAVGDKKFSTGTIAATIIATCIGGGFFSGAITESYRQGLYFIIPAMGEPLCLILIAYFFIPRMGEFLGNLSIAEALGNLYGKYVRVISAIAGIFVCIGIVSLQFKVGASIFKIFFGIDGFYAILVCAIITTLYSAFGGIRAVTFTDIIQFFTFGTIVPIISLIIWGTLKDPNVVFSTLTQSPLFDYRNVFDFSNSRFINTLFLLLFFLIPCFQPVFFQRILMAKNTIQGKNAFLIAGVVCLVLFLVISWVGILLLANNPNLDPDNLLSHIILNYNYTGLKGLTAVGILAIIMSSADSYINSSSVLFTNDILKPLNLKKIRLVNDLNIASSFAFFTGITGFILAFKGNSVLEQLLLIFSFYLPVVSTTLILTILGFRSTNRSVLIGMAASVITVIYFKIFSEIETIIPGMLANLICLIGSHYILGEQGGWVGIKNPSSLNMIRSNRRIKIKSIVNYIYNFNFITFCKQNAPKEDYIYSIFGIFCIISVFSTMYSMPTELQQQNDVIIKFIYHTVLIISTVFITYPVWPPLLKQEKFIVLTWNIAIPYVLVFSPTLLVIISNFGQFQLMILMLNMLIIALLLRWQISIFLIFITAFASISFYKWYMGLNSLDLNLGTLQFKIMYCLLLVSSILLIFLKPKQELQEKTEQKSDYLAHKLDDQTLELKKSLELKQEFLRNLEHESRTPITGISSMGQVLWDNYDKLSERQRRQGVKDIAKSSERLNSLISNILNLSKLSGLNYQLKIEDINFSELVYERVKTCKKLYTEDKYKDFQELILDIADNIIASCDKDYITTAIDNIVINAMQYCTYGKITIILYQNEQEVIFKVQDEGIGIPKEELYDVFGAFTVSSKTKTPAGGRGVGLALSKKVVDLHNGRIWAKQNSDKGVTIGFNLPLKN
jgi:Na+/proline symporter/signal transduction histidine kinase